MGVEALSILGNLSAAYLTPYMYFARSAEIRPAQVQAIVKDFRGDEWMDPSLYIHQQESILAEQTPFSDFARIDIVTLQSHIRERMG